jgi:hypothetical protein
VPATPTPRAITAAAARIMVFMVFLLCSDPLRRVLGSVRSLERLPRCDAQEIDLTSTEDNSD